MKVVKLLICLILLIKSSKSSSIQAGSNDSFARCEYIFDFVIYYVCSMSINNLDGREFDAIKNGFLPTGVSEDNIVEVSIINQRTSNIPSIICRNFPILKDLIVISSGLTTLKASVFESCTSLIALRISGNNLKAIPDGAFKHLAKVVQLELNNNQIEKITAQTFSGVSSVVNLLLQNNLLKEIPANAFTNMLDLDHLDISFNQIVRLDFTSFGGSMSSVVVIWAQNNKINEIDPLILNKDKRPKLTFLNLSSNQCIDADIKSFTEIPKDVQEQLNHCITNFKGN